MVSSVAEGRELDYGRTQWAVHPRRLPVNTAIHTTLVGLKPATLRLLIRRATSSASEPTKLNEQQYHLTEWLAQIRRHHFTFERY